MGGVSDYSKSRKKSRSRSNSIEKQYYKHGDRASTRSHQGYPLFSRGRSRTSSQGSYQSSVESGSDEGSEVSSIGEKSRRPNSLEVQCSEPINGNSDCIDTQLVTVVCFCLVEEPKSSQRKEMTEIDARLNALQEFMKRSLESAKNYSRKQCIVMASIFSIKVGSQDKHVTILSRQLHTDFNFSFILDQRNFQWAWPVDIRAKFWFQLRNVTFYKDKYYWMVNAIACKTAIVACVYDILQRDFYCVLF